jgi:hypothetical protein
MLYPNFKKTCSISSPCTAAVAKRMGCPAYRVRSHCDALVRRGKTGMALLIVSTILSLGMLKCEVTRAISRKMYCGLIIKDTTTLLATRQVPHVDFN